MKLIKKDEEVKVFKSAAAFYSYIDCKLATDGYVLVETCPVLKSETKIKEYYPVRVKTLEGRE
ncbi:MAG: hypothetical protein ACPLZD_04885 [Candidatus Saccharicenans sp.]|nr:hypothetical protein [Candidatus Aminicenantes bacterium]